MLSKKDVKNFLKGQFHPLPSLYQVPKNMLLDSTDSGIFFGDFDGFGYVGMPEGTDGNVAIIGGNGSGKTAGVIKPTLETWKSAIFALDLKGDINAWYSRYAEAAYLRGETPRPYLVFNPLDEDGIGYDPFLFLELGGKDALLSNIWDLVYVLIPEKPETRDPFWDDAAREILAAGIRYYFELHLGFIDSIIGILSKPVAELFRDLADTKDSVYNILIGGMADVKDETLASIECTLHTHLKLFATDPFIANALCGKQEGTACFSWEDLEESNIFLQIPPNKLEAWGPVVRLILTQLIRYLEMRPEKYDPEGIGLKQTLLLLDEFPRIGNVSCLASALATLRSKAVNICLVVQSLAQLDTVYGVAQRRIIADNCQFQMLLRANDAETQQLFADLIGTAVTYHRSMSVSYDEFDRPRGYSHQVSEIRDRLVQPHELATLQDILLVTPYGSCRVEKYDKHCLLSEADRVPCSWLITDWLQKLEERKYERHS